MNTSTYQVWECNDTTYERCIGTYNTFHQAAARVDRMRANNPTRRYHLVQVRHHA